jgi:hypothetical protein
MDRDFRHLKLLSIFYYVVAGLLALFSCIALVYLFMGIMFLTMPPPSGGGSPPPAAMGWFFIIISSAILLLGWCWATMIALAGWFLGKCRHYIFCMVMGCSALLFQPFGTVLGVFTIILLIRPNVKRLFETGGIPDEADEEEIEDFRDRFQRDSYNIRQ